MQRQRKIRQKPYDDERNDAHELTSEKEIKEIIDKIRDALEDAEEEN